ncbi:RnfH family protein [Buchnera aphidicola]|uniref:RnfH family protein n=1 Tax=Buchnera aphidicola TaxID=9 RepID=UPI0034643480
MKIIQNTVVYALPNKQYIYEINVQLGATVKNVILASNILHIVKNISLHNINVGIYNKLVHLNTITQDGDRIEIYRNLIIDPKERRRKKIFFHKN